MRAQRFLGILFAPQRNCEREGALFHMSFPRSEPIFGDIDIENVLVDRRGLIVERIESQLEDSQTLLQSSDEIRRCEISIARETERRASGALPPATDLGAVKSRS
jgi:hypothetical protein